MKYSIQARCEALKIAQEAIQTREDLITFMNQLLEAYDEGYFEEQDAREYLTGMLHITEAMDHWARNVGFGPGAPEQPSWKWMGRLLHVSFLHS
jgi:hypothetical protein